MTAGLTPSGVEIVCGAAKIPHVSLVQDRESAVSCCTATGWTILGDDTENLAASTSHILGTQSLEFDKTDGTDNTIFAGAYNTLACAKDMSRFCAHDELETAFYISDKTNVEYVFIRLGTDVSNYTEWRILAAAITQAVWDVHDIALSTCELVAVGAGWNPSAVQYVSLGVAFDLESRALVDIKFDHLYLGTTQLTA